MGRPLSRFLLALLLALAATDLQAGIEPSDIDLEPRLFGVAVLRFSPTRDVDLLEQYFRKNLLKHRDQVGAYIETVEHYRTRVLSDVPAARRRSLLDTWFDSLAQDHADLGPGLEAARLYAHWALTITERRPPAPDALADLARRAQEATAEREAPTSPWTYLVAGLVADTLASAAGIEGKDTLAPSHDLWARASAAAKDSDSHLHFVLADLLAATLPRAPEALPVFCKRVAQEYEKSLLVSPSDKQLFTAVAGRYHELFEALTEDGTQLPFWFEELVFKRLIAVEPTNARAHNNLSFLYSQYGVNLEEALKEAQIANQLLPGDPNLLDTLGWAHYKNGQLDKAVGFLRRSLSLDNEIADVHFHLATVLYDLEQFEEAIQHFRATVELDPENAFALNNLAYLFSERNIHVDEGLQLVDRALALEPDNSAFLDTKGWLLYRAGQLEPAAHFVAQAIALQPEVSELHLHGGQIALARGDFATASDHFEKALTYDPNNETLARDLARIHALEALRQARDRFARISGSRRNRRNFEVFYRALAEIHETDGQYGEAIQVLTEYRDLDPATLAGPRPPASTPGLPSVAGEDADLRAAVESLPEGCDMIVSLEAAGLEKVMGLFLDHAKLPFPRQLLAAPQVRARLAQQLPRRVLAGFDTSGDPDSAVFTVVLQLSAEAAQAHHERLASGGNMSFQVPGLPSAVQVRAGLYKGVPLGEIEAFSTPLAFALHGQQLLLAPRKSALVAMLDAPAPQRPALSGSDGFDELMSRLEGGEDAVLLAWVPDMLAGSSGARLNPVDRDFLSKVALVASRYRLDLEDDSLKEFSMLFPHGDESLLKEAAVAEAFARRAVQRFPAVEILRLESTFGVIENRIQGTLRLGGVRGWIAELARRLGSTDLDLPDLDLDEDGHEEGHDHEGGPPPGSDPELDDFEDLEPDGPAPRGPFSPQGDDPSTDGAPDLRPPAGAPSPGTPGVPPGSEPAIPVPGLDPEDGLK